MLLTLAVVSLHVMTATSAGPLWRDEANTVRLATLPTLGEVWNNLQYDSFPLLWLLIVRGYSALVGQMNDPAFRVLGFCVGVSVVGVLWLNARTFRNSFPLLSLSLLAMSPSLIVWGDSMRAYGFGIALILLTGALLWRFVEKPIGRRFAAAAIAAIASVHTLYYNSVLLLAFCAGAVAVCALNRAWKRAGLVVLIGGLAAISILPYAGTIRNASTWNVLVQIYDYDLIWFVAKLQQTLRPAGPWVLDAWVVLFALTILAGVRAVRLPGQLGISQRQREAVLFALVTLVVGVLAIFVFLHRLSYETQPWYYLTLLALAGVCIDAVFGVVSQTPLLRIARLVVVLLLASATFLPAMAAVRQRMTNVDLVASRLHEIAQPGDLVLVNHWHFGVTFNRYYNGRAGWMTVPPIAFHRFHRYDLLKQQMMVPDQTSPARQVIAQATEALRAGHRVFIVGRLELPSAVQPLAPLPPAPLPGHQPWPTNAYLAQWSLMVGDFLKRHSTTLESVHVEVRGSVNAYENAQLFVASGWRP
ncbi:MAG: hypothetical protein ABIU86_07450 [Gemmatimonadaceae bacterium]